jgi:hypothetical protein
MSFVNREQGELNCKVVYAGPGLSGRSTSMQSLYTQADPGGRGKLIALQTDTESILFFSFLPSPTLRVHGLAVRFHLYATCGCVWQPESDRVVLKGLSGVVFVVDPQPTRLDANVHSLETLCANLTLGGYDPATVPLVFQYNKRDQPGALPVARLRKALNPKGRPEFETVATQGIGVRPALAELMRQVIEIERAKDPTP